MAKKTKDHTIDDIVNAQQYQYTGERISIPLRRNDFYKIWLIESEGRLLFDDKDILIDKPALFFTNPLVPYAYESLSETRSGYWCVFKKEFLNTFEINRNMRASPLFNAANVDVYFLDQEQLATVKALFNMLITQVNSSSAFKEDIIRNYIYLLIYEGLKNKGVSSSDHFIYPANRITNSFLALLEKQFPIQSPEQPLQYRKASDFASRLAVHVNHLNHVVKEVTGHPTTSIIAERIMNEAKALLKHSDWNIADIAYALGFEYPNHFNSYFKKHEGVTPASYRNKPNI